MPLFHPSIIDKYIKLPGIIPPNHFTILQSWAESLTKGTFDRETSNDGEFIQRILIDVLGYCGSSSGSRWTLGKNQPIAFGNVDVALGNFTASTTEIIAPFELKGAKTRDLDGIMPGRNKSPVQQAWEYAMDVKGAKWVLVSNYREIRLYAIGYGRKDYEQFNLLQLTNPTSYARFLLLLSADNLLSDRTLAILKESETKEKDITNKLYVDYKKLRSSMISALSSDNSNIPTLEIIQSTQTILDRVLFVAFAEDKGLLPNGTLKSCYEDKNKWNPQPSWDNFKGLFQSIDKGNAILKIPGYNGGLFAQNEILDSLSVPDSVCEGFKTIGEYDFASDISVNILGHIFEQSIIDLEELKVERGEVPSDFDEKKSKRKKDGIFYTQPYITSYIVEQAVGGWLKEKRKKIGFDLLPELKNDDYGSIKLIKSGPRKNTVIYNKNVEQHLLAWGQYKEVLTHIKVLDPACGSGAFLNEVFDYLLREGQMVNNQLTALNGGQIMLFRWDKHILANNIYGVDINSESVEITKLSLWLKTANRNERLSYLDDNIKCGNSLIDNVAIAGKAAFNWKDEFPAIMNNGGFDIIVGNPPYVFSRENITEMEKAYYVSKFISAQYQINTYLLFIEQSLTLIKPDVGRLSLIVPNSWLMVMSAERLRKLLLEHTTIQTITNLLGYSFEKVNVETMIIDLVKRPAASDHKINILQNAEDNSFKSIHEKEQMIFQANKGFEFQVFLRNSDEAIIEKIRVVSTNLENIAEVKAGLQAYEVGKGIPKQTTSDVKNRIYDYDHKFDNTTYKYLDAVGRYSFNWRGNYLRFGPNLAAPRTIEIFNDDVVVVREIAGKYPYSIVATFIEKGDLYLFNRSNIAINPKVGSNYDLRYLLAILSSSAISYYYLRTNPKAMRQMFPKIILKDLRQFPIKTATPKEQLPFIEKVDILLFKNKELQLIVTKFLSLLQSEFRLSKLSEKLESWYLLDYSEFLEELFKKKISITLSAKAEWQDYFTSQKHVALEIKSVIDSTDIAIDQMVNLAYRLTKEEVSAIKSHKM